METPDAIARVFKTEPRRQPEKKKPDSKTAPPPAEKPKEEPKPADKPADKPAPRTSLFDDSADEGAPAPQPAPVDTSAEADEKIPENDWRRAKEVRSQLRTEIVSRDTKIKQLEQELAQYHEAVPDLKEVSRLKNEHKEFSDKVAILDYQNHPDYRQRFTEPKKKLVAEMQTILSDNSIQGVDLAAITSKPRAEMAKTISEITDQLNSFDAGEFRLQLRDYQKLSEAERNDLANHGDGLKRLSEQNQAKQRSAFEGQWKKTSFAAFAKKIEPASDASPDEVAQIKQFNEGLDQMRGSAEKYAFSIANEESAADVAIKAANYDFVVRHAFPRMKADYSRAVALNRELTKRLEELSAHTPKGGFDGAPPPQGAPKDEDISTLVKRTFRS